MKGKFLRHGDHEDRNLSAGNIYGKEDEVMQNKIKYQRKTHVHQAKKKKSMENNGKLQRFYTTLSCFSRKCTYSKGERYNLSFCKHLMLFLTVLRRIILSTAPHHVLCLKGKQWSQMVWGKNRGIHSPNRFHVNWAKS